MACQGLALAALLCSACCRGLCGQTSPCCTCCRCLSPFSLAGLLSDPLLLPDCSFSFSRAVAYANVSCRMLKHSRKVTGCPYSRHHPLLTCGGTDSLERGAPTLATGTNLLAL